jgi:transcriptional regulator with XRE-family HTH domain
MLGPKNELGSRVRQLREARGWSQAELAAHLPNVKQQSIDQLEKGKVARPRFLPELAYALNTTVAWLLTGEESLSSAPLLEASSENKIDRDLLKEIIVAVEKVNDQRALRLNPEEKAEYIVGLYDMAKVEEDRSRENLENTASKIIQFYHKKIV